MESFREADGSDVTVSPTKPLPVTVISDGSGGDASASNQATQITAANLTNTRLGDITAPAAGSVNARLSTILAALGTPLQAGGSIALPTGAATAANQTSELTKLDTLHADFIAATPAGSNIIGKVGIDQTTPGTTNAVVARGDVASGVADAGNPVKFGGYGSGTAPTAVSAGQRANSWLGLNGQTIVGGTTLAGANATSNTLVQMSIASGGSGHQTVAGFLHNGATWDMPTKPNATSRIASSAASTNATSAKATPGNIHSISVHNSSAAVKFLKIYNKATAPAVGTDTPVLTLAIPPSPGTLVISYPNGGYYLPVGISYALTGLAADTDTTALAAGDVVGLNIVYS